MVSKYLMMVAGFSESSGTPGKMFVASQFYLERLV